MADITIVNGAYKPTNITGGHHPAGFTLFFSPGSLGAACVRSSSAWCNTWGAQLRVHRNFCRSKWCPGDLPRKWSTLCSPDTFFPQKDVQYIYNIIQYNYHQLSYIYNIYNYHQLSYYHMFFWHFSMLEHPEDLEARKSLRQRLKQLSSCFGRIWNSGCLWVRIFSMAQDQRWKT